MEFVNIREGCATLHPRSRKKATQAARTLIRGALGSTFYLDHHAREAVGVPPVTLVVGEGKSAKSCLSALSEIGYETRHLEILSSPIIRTGGRFVTEGLDQELQADCLILAPTSGAELDYISRSVQLGDDRPLLDGKGPEDARRLGVFVCNPSEDPLFSGRGAAGEVLAWEGKLGNRSQQPAAWVDPLLCRNCGTCLEVCGLGIPALVEDQSGSHAWINPLLCEDCGTCAAHCPSGAIQPGVQTDWEIFETLKRVLS
jgi:heterodisulfide reductase subunit A-like polyferredoxin